MVGITDKLQALELLMHIAVNTLQVLDVLAEKISNMLVGKL